jgi:hypothetical protein
VRTIYLITTLLESILKQKQIEGVYCTPSILGNSDQIVRKSFEGETFVFDIDKDGVAISIVAAQNSLRDLGFQLTLNEPL